MVGFGPEVVVRRVEKPGSRIKDDIVFFDDEAGKYYASGPVGADIWEMLSSPKTVAEICEHLLSVYEIDRDACEAQVQAFLSELHRARLIRVETP